MLIPYLSGLLESGIVSSLRKTMADRKGALPCPATSYLPDRDVYRACLVSATNSKYPCNHSYLTMIIAEGCFGMLPVLVASIAYLT